jgi:hypothetical protein
LSRGVHIAAYRVGADKGARTRKHMNRATEFRVEIEIGGEDLAGSGFEDEIPEDQFRRESDSAEAGTVQ